MPARERRGGRRTLYRGLMDWENLLETLLQTLKLMLKPRLSASLWLLHGGLEDRDVGLVGRRYKGSRGWHKTGRADHWCRTTYIPHTVRTAIVSYNYKSE